MMKDKKKKRKKKTVNNVSLMLKFRVLWLITRPREKWITYAQWGCQCSSNFHYDSAALYFVAILRNQMELFLENRKNILCQVARSFMRHDLTVTQISLGQTEIFAVHLFLWEKKVFFKANKDADSHCGRGPRWIQIPVTGIWSHAVQIKLDACGSSTGTALSEPDYFCGVSGNGGQRIEKELDLDRKIIV